MRSPGVRAAEAVRRCAAARLRLPAGPLRRHGPGGGSYGRVVPGRRARGPQAGLARSVDPVADRGGPAQARRPLAAGRAGAARAAPAGQRAGARRGPVGDGRRPDPGPRGARPARRTTGPRSRCATSTGCRYPRWPGTWTAPSRRDPRRGGRGDRRDGLDVQRPDRNGRRRAAKRPPDPADRAAASRRDRQLATRRA